MKNDKTYANWKINNNNKETGTINRYELDTIIYSINQDSTINNRTYDVIIDSNIDRKILNQPITVVTKI